LVKKHDIPLGARRFLLLLSVELLSPPADLFVNNSRPLSSCRSPFPYAPRPLSPAVPSSRSCSINCVLATTSEPPTLAYRDSSFPPSSSFDCTFFSRFGYLRPLAPIHGATDAPGGPMAFSFIFLVAATIKTFLYCDFSWEAVSVCAACHFPGLVPWLSRGVGHAHGGPFTFLCLSSEEGVSQVRPLLLFVPPTSYSRLHS